MGIVIVKLVFNHVWFIKKGPHVSDWNRVLSNATTNAKSDDYGYRWYAWLGIAFLSQRASFTMAIYTHKAQGHPCVSETTTADNRVCEVGEGYKITSTTATTYTCVSHGNNTVTKSTSEVFLQLGWTTYTDKWTILSQGHSVWPCP